MEELLILGFMALVVATIIATHVATERELAARGADQQGTSVLRPHSSERPNLSAFVARLVQRLSTAHATIAKATGTGQSNHAARSSRKMASRPTR